MSATKEWGYTTWNTDGYWHGLAAALSANANRVELKLVEIIASNVIVYGNQQGTIIYQDIIGTEVEENAVYTIKLNATDIGSGNAEIVESNCDIYDGFEGIATNTVLYEKTT